MPSPEVQAPVRSRRFTPQPCRKTRVLLVHPQGSNWVPGEADLTRFANIMPPVGLASIAAYLEQRGVETAILDGYAIPRSTDDMVRDALATEPDVVGFSVTTSGFTDAYRIALGIRAARPELPFVFGGVHVSALKQRLLEQHPEIDYGVIGEGEATLHELITRMDDPASVPGLVYREGGEVKLATGHRQLLELDSLPFPAYEKLPGFPGAYHLAIFNYGKAPGTSTVTSRGCPYTCTYCDRSVYQRSYRFNSSRYIHDHLKYLRDRFGIRHVTFYDDLFTFDRDRVVGLCRLLIDEPLGVTFACDVRVNHIDDDLARLLKAAGCYQVAFGIESGDAAILKATHRDPNVEPVRQAARLLRKAGMRVKGLFMMGLPGEDEAAIKKSMDFALSLPLDEVNLAKFTPFPGAPLYATIRQHGQFDEDWSQMNCMNFTFVPQGLTRERLEELYSQFIIAFFNRPRIWWGYVSMVWRSPHSVLTFFRHAPSFIAFGMALWFKSTWTRLRGGPKVGSRAPQVR